MKKIYFVNKSVINSKNYFYLSGFKGKHFGKKPKLTTIELLAENNYNKKLIKDYLAKVYPVDFTNSPEDLTKDRFFSYWENLCKNNKDMSVFKGWLLKNNSSSTSSDILVESLIELILKKLSISEKSKLKLKSKSSLIKQNTNVKDLPNTIYFDKYVKNLPRHFTDNSLVNSLTSVRHKKKFYIKK